MKKQIEILRSDIQVGDVIVTSNVGNSWIKVEREVKDPTPREQVEEILLEVKRRGGNNFVADMDVYTDRVMAVLPKPAPLTQTNHISRGRFIDTLEKTVADNDLDVGTDFLRAIVFASDRLRLR